MYESKQLHCCNRRTGAIVPFVAILLVALLGLVALVIDYGIILVSQQELQNAADAAAVATIDTYNTDFDFADLAAFETLTSNELLTRSITFDMQRDVEYGRWDGDTRTFTVIPREGNPGTSDVSGQSIPVGADAVRVTLRRAEALNNGIRLFFAPVIGVNFADVSVQAIAAGPTVCDGFVGLEFADLRNDLFTDAYNSEQGPYEPGTDYTETNVNRFPSGDVCSNGPVTLASGAQINGNAQGSSVEIAAGSGADISGSRSITVDPLVFEDVDFSEAAVNDNSTIERGPTYAPPFLTPDGDLIVDNGRDITLQSGTYLFRNLTVAGGSQLHIVPPVSIYVEGEATLDNGTEANNGGNPGDFVLNVGAGPVMVQGGHNLHGIIYAPQADVTVANDGGFFGTIVGKSLTVAGGAQLHYDRAQSDLEDLPPEPATLVF